MAKRKLTLNIEESLSESMKILAVRVRRSLSSITEELYQQCVDGCLKRSKELEREKE